MSALADALRRFTSLDPQPDAGLGTMAAEAVAGFIPGVGQAMAARDIERGRRAGSPADMAMGAAGLMPWGKLGSTMSRIIAGKRARNAPVEELEAAEAALAAGAKPEDTWQMFGAYQGPENHAPMKWEIDDSKAKLLDRAKNPVFRGNLDEIIDHPEFFANYPQMRKYHVDGALGPHENGSGSFSADLITPENSFLSATGRNEEELIRTLLHEMQHGVQRAEGFDPGANSKTILAGLLRQPGADKVSTLGLKKRADQMYMNNMGEAEARAVERRFLMDPAVKKFFMPRGAAGGYDRSWADLIADENLPVP